MIRSENSDYWTCGNLYAKRAPSNALWLLLNMDALIIGTNLYALFCCWMRLIFGIWTEASGIRAELYIHYVAVYIHKYSAVFIYKMDFFSCIFFHLLNSQCINFHKFNWTDVSHGSGLMQNLRQKWDILYFNLPIDYMDEWILFYQSLWSANNSRFAVEKHRDAYRLSVVSLLNSRYMACTLHSVMLPIHVTALICLFVHWPN